MKLRALCAFTAVLALGIGALGATPALADEVNIPDPALRTCVASALSAAGLPAESTPTNLEQLTKLSCWSNGTPFIRDLSGLDHLSGLVSLHLSNTTVTELSPLTALTGLTSLELYSTELTDAGPLSHLTKLGSLRLNAPKVNEVGYIAPMTDLTWMDLAVGPTPDLTPVWDKTELQYLALPVDRNSDLSPLSGLTNLRSLQLHTFDSRLPAFTLPAPTVSLRLWSDGTLASIANLPDAPQLTYFEIWQASALQSLDGIEGFTGLTTATVQGTALSDISAVSGLSRLEALGLNSGSISDLSPLAGLTALTSLNIDNNKVTDISPLRHLTALRTLWADGDRVADLSPLRDLTELRNLGLSNSTATDLTPLAALSELQHLQWWQPPAADLSPLAGLEHLTWLEAPYGSLTTLGPEGGLKHLTLANFAGNRLQSVAALQGASKLTRLDLSNNWQLGDIRPLSGLPGNANVRLEGDGIKDLSPLPDTVTYTAYRQNARFDPVLAGSSTDLGIRDITGAALCPTFTTPGPTCAGGVVTYPVAPGVYEGTVGSGADPGAGLGMRFEQYTYTPWDFNTTLAPTISGSPAVGRTLKASVKPWIPLASETRYQWRRAGRTITGATTSTYVLTAADRGLHLSVCVTGHRDYYNDRTRCSGQTATVAAGEIGLTPKPVITGSPRTDVVLVADSGTWDTGVILHYQWQRNGHSITGATSTTYTVKAGDVGDLIRVRVKATAPGYHSHTEYSTSVRVHKALLLPVVPTVTGDAKVGATLTADAGTWGPAPVTLAYQWFRGATAVRGATAPSFTLTDADLGTVLSVRITASRAGYYTSRRTSAPTAAVVAA